MLSIPVNRRDRRWPAWKKSAGYLLAAFAALFLCNFLAWPLLLVPDIDASVAFAIASARAAAPLEQNIFQEPMTAAHCARDVQQIAQYENHWVARQAFAGRPIRNHLVPVEVGLLYREALYAGRCRNLAYVTSALRRYRAIAREDQRIDSLRDLPFHLPFSVFTPTHSMAAATAKSYARALGAQQVARGLCLARANRAGALNSRTRAACLNAH